MISIIIPTTVPSSFVVINGDPLQVQGTPIDIATILNTLIVPPSGGILLQESGDAILLETGDSILLD